MRVPVRGSAVDVRVIKAAEVAASRPRRHNVRYRTDAFGNTVYVVAWRIPRRGDKSQAAAGRSANGDPAGIGRWSVASVAVTVGRRPATSRLPTETPSLVDGRTAVAARRARLNAPSAY